MKSTKKFLIETVKKCGNVCKDTWTRPERTRGYWSNDYDFLLSVIGYVVGLGNLWGFPALCYNNGGSAFFIPYIIMMVFASLPLIFMELAFGQFTNMGPVHGWKACPAMTGVGWAVCAMSGAVSIYYTLIIGWSFYYLFASLTSKLPWSDCKNEWNDIRCYDNMGQDRRPCIGYPNDTIGNCTYETATQQYFERVVMGYVNYQGIMRKMTDPLGGLQWHLVLCLLLSWLIIFLCLLRGIRTSGKVVHFTAVTPYVVLLLLLLRGLSLPGSWQGIKALFTPNFSLLLKASTWSRASIQALFSMSCCLGGLPTLASYNKPHNNCHRDALIICIIDFVSSLVGSLAVFSILGYMAHNAKRPVESIVKSDTGLAFIAFTEAMASMSGGPFWSCLFFLLLITLGIDSAFVLMETLFTAISDQWPKIRQSAMSEITTKAIFTGIFFLLGVPMCCKGGIYVFKVFDNYVASYNLYVLAICQIAGVVLFYDLDNFTGDIAIMLGFKPGFFWKISWTLICPGLLLFILIISISKYERPIVNGEPMAEWGELLGWGLISSSLLIVVFFAVTWRPSLTVRQRSDLLENRMLRELAVASGTRIRSLSFGTSDQSSRRSMRSSQV